jgi:GH24 family phage-related lysozyme (muramidase)
MTVKQRLQRIQQHLGVEDDGILGPVTLTAAERRLGLLAPPSATTASVPVDNSLSISKASIDLIIRCEISSPAHYNRVHAKPTWPGGASGVTIGIGYDLGYNTKAQIRADWGTLVGDTALSHLLSASGIKGTAAQGATRTVRAAGIKIPLAAARQVFAERTLPRYAMLTRLAWPGVEKLPYDAQGALLSLVFNRGSSLRGARRAEMAAIRPLAAAEDLNGIAGQIVKMKRLWAGKGLDGLLKRREAEAMLVRNASHVYDPADVVHV